jgi:hypothetical protein
MKRSKFAILAALAGVAFLAAEARTAQAQTAAKPATTQTAPTAGTTPRPKFVAPVRGEAEVGHLRPNTKVVGNEVVTIFKVKNLSNGAIAGLRIEEYWYDKNNPPRPADSQRLKKPLLPGEVATIELHTPKNPGMQRNSYKFSHANGAVKTKLLAKID